MLKNVYYYLELKFSLISTVLLCNNRFVFIFKYLKYKIKIVKLTNNLYIL